MNKQLTAQEFFLAISNKKHIIFDFDATIATLDIDWSDWYPGLIKIIKKYDSSFEKGNLRGSAFNNIKNKLKKQHGPSLSNELLGFQEGYEASHYNGYTEHKKVVKIIERLVTSGWKASLWTSNTKEIILPILEKLRLQNAFQQIVTRNDVEFEKPDPEGFKKIINHDEQPLEEFLMIGDSSSDKDAAYNSGIAFLHIGEISDHLPEGWSL